MVQIFKGDFAIIREGDIRAGCLCLLQRKYEGGQREEANALERLTAANACPQFGEKTSGDGSFAPRQRERTLPASSHRPQRCNRLCVRDFALSIRRQEWACSTGAARGAKKA